MIAALSLAACSPGPATQSAQKGASAPMMDDPYLWLEEVEGERALEQVKAWNASTAAELTADADFEAYRQRGEAILSNPDRIATPYHIMGDMVSNFWTDTKNTHGLWRVATIDDYLAGTPAWRTLLDLDALSEAENKNWVWGSVTCLAPEYDRCLIRMSDGGSDAGVLREFDVSRAAFVEDGFVVGEAKHDFTWVDADTILISSDFGPGTLTQSGYGRQVKMWKRGQTLADAPLIKEIAVEDVGFGVSYGRTRAKNYPLITRNMTFWDYEYFHVRPDGSLVKVPMPQTATVSEMFAGKGIIQLNAPWGAYPAGSLLAYDLDALIERGEFGVEPVFTPTKAQSVRQIAAGKDRLYLAMLQDVSGKLLALDADWRASEVPVPDNSVVDLEAAGGTADIAFFTAQNFATPPTLFATQMGAEPAAIASLDNLFDPATVEVKQHFATSKDGTRIPYFVVRPKGATGPLPTVLHVYGGFRGGQLPTYLARHPSRIGPMAMFWVEAGNSFVLANIRGGDEYGPEWHSQVLKENRQKVHDDLYAVGEDLKASGLSSTLAASGRSNGGLVVGAAYTQRPDLFDGIIMGVPLSDMWRYDKLLAGASWTGEYGDPDIPEEWAYLGKYSPYQHLRADADYPPIMIYTSTKDDRVHPGHARKMAARMTEQGHKVYYFENIDGGHIGAADAAGEAYRAALMMIYAKDTLTTAE
ncbi:S9 family peptidase [Pacificimonas sp. WHA3]|uniref:S9 family peptidase n=2 Tax=Pacificimonas pallii TaxID=2827236 RepID=A0ABS6SBY8_9SPHN|nr:S9 family peptidase [Pacificimonas pallii]